MLSGNQEKAIATLKRIATENGAPMPLGKLIISRQVSAWKTDCGMCVPVHEGACIKSGACMSVCSRVCLEWVWERGGQDLQGEFSNSDLCVFTATSQNYHGRTQPMIREM